MSSPNELSPYISQEDIKTLTKTTPNNLSGLVDALLTYMPKFGINTRSRVAMFLANASHETGGFTTFSENLNYSTAGLMKTWPKRYPTKEIAGKYNKKPREIANKSYADRYGNGDEASGDGYKYRGRGIFQTTFKDNYKALELATGIKCVDTPDMLTFIPEAVISACYYWSSKKLNTYADKEDVTGCRIAINGGVLGLDEVTSNYNLLMKSLKGKLPEGA